MRKARWILVILVLVIGAALAQRGSRGRFGGGGFGRDRFDHYESARTAREIPQHGNRTPSWTNAVGFEQDAFTFARIKRERTPYSSGGPWWTDVPDSDLNLAYRLQWVTSMKVDPDGRFLHLTDKELARYPFIYMVEPGSLYLSDAEAAALRKYLLNGGFLMLDDFWGEREWMGMAGELKKVFPERSFVDLPLDHPIYHCVFDIKSKGQVPNVQLGTESRFTGITWERPDAREVHHRVIYDDKGRIMVIATHNTDNGDGWEWEADNPYYFERFSEKIAYPLAVNIIFYAMSH